MKTIATLLLTLIIGNSTFAAFSPPAIPLGIWNFNETYKVTNLRVSEIVASPGNKPSDRVIELRNSGFLCIHQSPVKYLCTKNLKDAELTTNQEAYLIDRFKGFQIEFLPTVHQAQLIFDGSEQSDYLMKQNLTLAGSNYSQYGITVSSNGITHFKFIAENDESPNIIATYENSIFAIPVIMQSKINGQTWGYSLNVFLAKLTQ